MRAEDAERAQDGPPPDYEARAREICLRLLTARARSRAELATALHRRGVPDGAAEAVLDRLGDVGLIDDAAVARAMVDGGIARGLARPAVAVKLRQRGIDEDEIRSVLADVDPEAELEAARALAARRSRQLAALAPEVRARRLAGQLARRGYSPGVVHRVVREVEREVGRDTDVAVGEPID